MLATTETYLVPEDPEGSRDDEGGGDEYVCDEVLGDDGVLDPARGLTDDILIDRLHTETAEGQTLA